MKLPKQAQLKILSIIRMDLKDWEFNMHYKKATPNAGKNHLIMIILKFGQALSACGLTIQAEVVGAYSTRAGVEKLYKSGVQAIDHQVANIKG